MEDLVGVKLGGRGGVCYVDGWVCYTRHRTVSSTFRYLDMEPDAHMYYHVNLHSSSTVPGWFRQSSIMYFLDGCVYTICRAYSLTSSIAKLAEMQQKWKRKIDGKISKGRLWGINIEPGLFGKLIQKSYTNLAIWISNELLHMNKTQVFITHIPKDSCA